ncbi:MAG: hypothetical protein O3A46_08595 [Candidatus Poribacteria bacterium]|nr:hypothetical protein [Candidatus Poribacteria bacterium]
MRFNRLSMLAVAAILWAASAIADQVIYVKVSDFNPAKSVFDKDVKGNTWVETDEEGSLFGVAYGGPGDNNRDGGDPHLAIQLPVEVKSGEATSNGKVWHAWGRFLMPEALATGNNSNSLHLRMSPDGQTWTPAALGSNELLWNDPGGAVNATLFPAMVSGIDSMFTNVGEDLLWMWVRHKATENGPRAPDSTTDPTLAVGENWAELGVRESDPVKYPRIEILCFRNDGGLPSDDEAVEWFASVLAVSPTEKTATIWATFKSGLSQ